MESKEQKSNYEEKILEELDTDTIPEVAKRENRIANFFDNRVEPYMWNAKFFIILAIMCSLIVSIGLILYGVYETIGVLQLLFKSQDPKEIELATLSIVDIFLFGMVMMIFAFGTYNLFISKLDNVSRSWGSGDSNSISNPFYNSKYCWLRQIQHLCNLVLRVSI